MNAPAKMTLPKRTRTGTVGRLCATCNRERNRAYYHRLDALGGEGK